MFRVCFRWRWLFAAWVGALPLLSGIAGQKPRSLYDGAAAAFEQAQLIKPMENSHHSRAVLLAPLIIQEVLGDKASPASPTKVYFQSGSIQLQGLRLEQMTYWWSHGEERTENPPGSSRATRSVPVFKGGARLLLASQTPSPPRAAGTVQLRKRPLWDQGVRLTMNTNGVPVIYELLGGNNSIRQIFVTQSVEARAMVEFGQALPGRRHAVEPGLNEAPGIVVPRVLNDPPDIMGPILYLEAETHALATLICRCMDAQAMELVGQALYELVPAPRSGNTADATRLDAANPRGLPEDFTIPLNDLSRSLRLPREF